MRPRRFRSWCSPPLLWAHLRLPGPSLSDLHMQAPSQVWGGLCWLQQDPSLDHNPQLVPMFRLGYLWTLPPDRRGQGAAWEGSVVC